MKIVQVDNFDRELIGTSDDRLVAENIRFIGHAEAMCAALNEKYSSDQSAAFFRVESDDYVLRIYAP